MSYDVGHTDIRIGSERSFGLVFAAFFFILSMFPALFGNEIRWWALALALVFLVAALCFSRALRPLNRGWFRLGLMLNSVVSPLVMALLFFLVVMPVGVVRRVFVRDPLGQKLDRDAESYWIAIEPAQKKRSSMRDQF